MSIHTCNIHCRTIDLDQAELLAMEDKGKWMPYMFLLDIIIGCKLSSDDEDDISNDSDVDLFFSRQHLMDTLTLCVFSHVVFRALQRGQRSWQMKKSAHNVCKAK